MGAGGVLGVGDVWDDCEDISLTNKHVVGGGIMSLSGALDFREVTTLV